jgi:hypothetical protein
VLLIPLAAKRAVQQRLLWGWCWWWIFSIQISGLLAFTKVYDNTDV